MAYNRPKSLDELNSIFDKTIAAEKAIKKNSSKIEKGEDKFSSFTQDSKSEDDENSDITEAPSEPITENVSDFIAKFSAEPEPAKARPQMTFLSTEAPLKPEEQTIEPIDSISEAAQPAPTERTDRDELFKDYARIMSDDDDDASDEKKLSRKEKKLLKKKERAEKKAAREKAAAEKAEDSIIDESAIEEPADPDTVAEEPVIEEPVIDDPSVEDTVTENQSDDADDSDSFEFSDDEYNERPFEALDPAEDIYVNIKADETDDFDFPEDHIPEWMKEEEESYEEIEYPLADKTKSLHIFLKSLLSIILILIISVGALATILKTVVAVNTGKLVADKYYVFTTYTDYTDLGLGKGDLVITEKKFAEDGEIFAYVDYSSRTFEFGKRTDSITKEDGEVLYVIEKDGSRTLVSRDDCKGVISLTYKGRGNIVSFLTDNYVILIALVVVISLAIILTFFLAFRSRKDEDFSEYEAAGESEDDFEDIFSTIE